MKFTALHKAALTRAYRTLAQGLAGSTTATALAALIASLMSTDTTARQAAIIAALSTVSATIIAAFTAFWQGVYGGLPEVDPLAGAISVTPAVGSDGSALARVELANGIEEYLPAGAVKRKRAAKASTS